MASVTRFLSGAIQFVTEAGDGRLGEEGFVIGRLEDPNPLLFAKEDYQLTRAIPTPPINNPYRYPIGPQAIFSPSDYHPLPVHIRAMGIMAPHSLHHPTSWPRTCLSPKCASGRGGFILDLSLSPELLLGPFLRIAAHHL